ncbi:uncharacterized protein [Ptychodera flava]|uniref:uncharacterized protein n=1 Tax=Ptychodera flava TaxID=63121 RepID=UPI003969F8F9
MSYFPIFSAYALPPPAYNAELLHDPKNKSELNPDFLKKVEHFREMIATKLKPKCAWPGIGHVYGEQFCELVQRYLDALTTPGVIPNVQSTWSQILEAQFTKEIDDAEDEYKKNMEKDIKLPCDEMELQGKHKEAYDIAIKKFKHGTATIKNAEMSDQKMTELKERIVKYESADGKTTVVGGIFYELMKRNADASEKKCKEVAQLVWKDHIKYMNIEKMESFKRVESVVEQAIDIYKDKARGPKVNEVLQNELLQL